MRDPRCYRNRCHVWSLYWASQSIRPNLPDEICNINYAIIELPTADIPIADNITIPIDRATSGFCDYSEQVDSTEFTFTDEGGGTVNAVKIITIPRAGYLTVGTVIVSAGDIILVPEDFTTGFYYHPDNLNTAAYDTEFLFQLKTVESEIYSNLATGTINVTLCTNQGPVALNNTLPIDRTLTASCLVSEEYVNASIFTFTDVDSDSLNAIKIISLPVNGNITIGLHTPITIGDIIEVPFLQSLYYHTATSVTDAYDDILEFQVRTDGIGEWSNIADLTFNVTTCVNINELPVAENNSLVIDRLTEEACVIYAEYTEVIFTFTDSEEDALNAIKIVALPTTGTLTTGLTGVILVGDIITLPLAESFYYTTDLGTKESYIDTIDFEVRTEENLEFSNTATITLDVTECVNSATPCVDYEPHFDFVTGGIGLLDAGILTSDVATIGDYVIEWRLGSVTGELKLVSASSYSVSDTDINQIHPFDPPIPMEAGTYYPVLRWIEVDGVIYHSDSNLGDIYGEDLIDCVDIIDVLEPIVVEALTCANGVTSNLPDYDHRFTYNNSSNPAEAATLSSTMYLNEDASTKYIVWQFHGYQVSDEINFYYISGETRTLLEQVAIGNDTDYVLSGIGGTWGSYYFESALDLRDITYTIGDEILIEIDPSYAQPSNTNTNWDLYLKCVGDIFGCDYINEDWRTIDPCTVSGIFNTTACQLEITFNTLAAITKGNEYKYLNPIEARSDYSRMPQASTNEGVMISKFKTTASAYYTGNAGSCTNIDSIITHTKDSGIISIAFSDSDRYDDFKAIFNTKEAVLLGLGYVNDPTDYKYYMWFEYFAWDGEQCGDIATMSALTWHMESTWTFDDVNYIFEVTPIEITNQLTDVSCSDIYEIVDSSIYSINKGYNLTNGYSRISHMISSNYMRGRYIYAATIAEVERGDYTAIRYPKWNIEKICGVPTMNYQSVAYYYQFYKYNLMTIVTNTGDIENNFELWDRLVNGVYTSDRGQWTLVYKIENGTVTTPSCP